MYYVILHITKKNKTIVWFSNKIVATESLLVKTITTNHNIIDTVVMLNYSI